MYINTKVIIDINFTNTEYSQSNINLLRDFCLRILKRKWKTIFNLLNVFLVMESFYLFCMLQLSKHLRRILITI